MSKYPEVITVRTLEVNAGISDDQLARDIADTEAEITNYRRLEAAEREVATVHPSAMERRMADFKAGARPRQIADREAFVSFLRKLQAARADGLVTASAPPEARDG